MAPLKIFIINKESMKGYISYLTQEVQSDLLGFFKPRQKKLVDFKADYKIYLT